MESHCLLLIRRRRDRNWTHLPGFHHLVLFSPHSFPVWVFLCLGTVLGLPVLLLDEGAQRSVKTDAVSYGTNQDLKHTFYLSTSTTKREKTRNLNATKSTSTLFSNFLNLLQCTCSIVYAYLPSSVFLHYTTYCQTLLFVYIYFATNFISLQFKSLVNKMSSCNY